jgi:hypothetical protein
MAIGLGIASVCESFGLLSFGYYVLDLRSDTNLFQTFAFEALFVLGMANIFVARTRDWFFKSRPSWLLLIAILTDCVIVVTVASVGIPAANFPSIPFWMTAIMLGWVFMSMLLNDLIKMTIIVMRRRSKSLLTFAP